MPTLKDIQEKGEKEFYEKSDKRVEKGGFTYLYENRDELNLETIKDFLHQQTTLAYQAGREEVFSENGANDMCEHWYEEGKTQTLDMVLKVMKSEYGLDEDDVRSIKEKIISNSK